VVMRVRPEVSSGKINPDTERPEKETTELETDVLLADGQGIVIGGLIQEKNSNIQSKIPRLGDIRWLGLLFQRRETEKTRSEIVIALLPRVLPYRPEYQAVDEMQTYRAAAPLLHGPLNQCPRPWEPKVPDAVYNPRVIPLPCVHGSACRPRSSNQPHP
jgi:type IV pilus assembly protein PilQ